MFVNVKRSPISIKKTQLITPNSTELSKFINTLGPEELLALSGKDAALWIMLHILQYGQLLTDKNPFSFNDHRYLIPVYACDSQDIIVMKGSQLGLTTWLMLKILHFLVTAPTVVKAGIYFPTEALAGQLSKDRLVDLLADNPSLKEKMGWGGKQERRFVDSQTLYRVGPCSLYVSYMGGKATQDSTPFDLIALDEVRLMDMTNFPRISERLSHSKYKKKIFISTAGVTNQDIHAKFQEGDQRYFHTKCGCGKHPEDWVIMSDVFPECIMKTGKGKNDYGYVCPKCNYRIHDPQNGQYVAHKPENAPVTSFHIHQMLSPYISPAEVINSFYQAEREGGLKEWFNGKMGVPYVDEKEKLDEDIIKGCVNEGLLFGINKKMAPPEIAMGIDQRGGENHVVILQRVHDRYQLIHLEVIDQMNPVYKKYGKIVSPFVRCCELMEQFKVNLCVCDREPNTNEAMAFGREFPGKVWLMKYADYIDQPVLWSDRPVSKKKIPEKPATRKSKKELKYPWGVKLHRYSTIERTLNIFRTQKIIIPNPTSIAQYIRDKQGNYVITFICLEIYFKHLMAVVKTVERSKRKAGETVARWVEIGKTDPHFLHATTYACVAMERIKGFDFSFV